MKKSNFVALNLGTIGLVLFALGMCMCLLPQWNLARQGIAAGMIGVIVFIITFFVWRKMEGKEAVKLSMKSLRTVIIGVSGALLLGVGMSLSMVLGKMILGIGIGLVGIIVLLLLIPVVKGLR